MEVKKYFKDISPRTWEHPADRSALNNLRRLPGLDELVRKLVGSTNERSVRLLALASAVRTSERQFPKVYKMMQEACAVLDVKDQPEVYVSQNPIMNAGAIGVDKPFVMLNTSLLERLSDEELLGVIGHELGHCLSGHALYKTLLYMLINLSTMVFNIPVSQVALFAIITALKEWDRKSELTADRAGILVMQDQNAFYQTMMKLAGGAQIGEMDVNDFFLQASEYEAGGDVVDSVYKILNLMGQTHPFPVLRIAEMKTWIDSGAYGKVLNGEYMYRDEETDDFFKDMSDAAKQYEEDLNRSQDPLAKSVRELSKNFDDLRKNAEGFFGSFFRQ
ncbi:MAG: M48 family metallopeptidase [Spirochaetia bacterium]